MKFKNSKAKRNSKQSSLPTKKMNQNDVRLLRSNSKDRKIINIFKILKPETLKLSYVQLSYSLHMLLLLLNHFSCVRLCATP